MNTSEMKALFDTYVDAANRHDGELQMSCMDERCFFENIPLASRVEGKQAVDAQYQLVLQAFPDYGREIEIVLADDDVLAASWRLRGTLRGHLMGQEPTGRAINVPIVSVLTFKDGLIEGERILYDIATLCAQAGLNVAAVRSAAGLAPA